MAKPILIRRNTPQDQDAMRQALGDSSLKISTPASEIKLHLPDSETTYLPGQVYKVPLFRLMRSENNARVFYSADELEEMSASLTDNGQDIPVVAYPRNGRLIIVDGQKRFQAATSAGIETLTVLIVQPPTDEGFEYEESRRINLNRSTQTALDDAVRWQSLMMKGVYSSQDDLAERLGVSKSTVSKTLGINRISERLLRVMAENQKTRALSIAYEVSNIFASEAFKDAPEKASDLAQEMVDEIIKKDLGRSQVQSLIEARLKGPVSRERGMSTQIKYAGIIGSLKVFPSRGQVDFSFKGLPEAKVEELKEMIEKMLAGQLSI